MNATEARAKIVAAILAVEAEGFTVYGHWSGALSIHRDGVAHQDPEKWSEENYATIDFDDDEFKGGGA